MRIEELGIYSNIFQFFILKSSSKMYQKKNFPLRGHRGGGLAPPKTPHPSLPTPSKNGNLKRKSGNLRKGYQKKSMDTTLS